MSKTDQDGMEPTLRKLQERGWKLRDSSLFYSPRGAS